MKQVQCKTVKEICRSIGQNNLEDRYDMIIVIRVSCQVQVAQPMALGIRILAIWFYLACCEFVFSLPLISPEIP